MRSCKNHLVGICQRLALWLLLAAGCWLLAAAPALAAEDFDSEFRQLSGMIVSGDFDTAGNLCLELGDGTSVCISASDLEDIVAGSGYWVYDGGGGTLSPVIPSSDAVLLEGSGTALLVDAATGGSSSAPAVAVTTTGDSPGIRIIQEDGPAIYLRGVGTAAGAQAWFEENSSAPPTPGATEWALYFKSDGLYVMDDAGVETGPLSDGGGGGGSMDDWNMAGDLGTPQTVDDGETVTAAGSGGIDVSVGATNTWTFALDTTEVGNTTWDGGTWTFSNPLVLRAASVRFDNGSTSASETRWYEDSDNGTNYFWTAVKDNLASTEGMYWPTDAAANGDKLTWHTGGATSWDPDPTLHYQTAKDEGSAETQRSALNFIGDNVDLTDDAGNDETDVTIRDWQDHMSSIGNGLNAINATDVTAATSNTSYCVYVGTAVKSYTTCTVNVQVTTGAGTITWAEVAIATGDWVPNGNPSLTTRGSTSVSATYNGTGTKSTTISLSGISPGDDLWFVWGSQATTPFILRAIQDDISDLGLTGSSAATRPSTMGAGTTFTRSSTNNPARVVVGL